MKKATLLVIASFMALVSFGQDEVADTTISNGVNDVFYSFRGGVLKTEPADNWDIAFEISGFTASILINEGAGVQLYKSTFADEEWADFDTTGMSSWSEQFNSRESWTGGAFNRGLSSDFDLGWGQYDVNTHQVRGDSIFLIKLRDGSWKKIVIINLASNTYNFKFADVDGQNEKSSSLRKSNFSGKLFGYYSLTEDKSIDREPSGAIWDMVFTTYKTPISFGGPPTMYPVYGVKTYQGTEVAQRDGIDVSSNDTTNMNWSTSITTIGSDWKSYDMAQQKYVITEDLSFIVKTAMDEVWKIYFTDYQGGSEGRSIFNVTNLKSSVSVETIDPSSITAYPNPAVNVINVSFEKPISNGLIEIVDLNGRVISSNEVFGTSMEIDVTQLTQGFYNLRIVSEQGVINKKFLKN